MERELDFKDKRLLELEAELKIMRSEREQFVEMGVRLEIQTKELGLMTRDLKQHGSGSKRSPGRNFTASKSSKLNSTTTASSQFLSLKKYVQKALGGSKGKKLPEGGSNTKQVSKKKIASPLDITAASNANVNMTMAMPSCRSPRGGQFDKGNITMRSPDESIM